MKSLRCSNLTLNREPRIYIHFSTTIWHFQFLSPLLLFLKTSTIFIKHSTKFCVNQTLLLASICTSLVLRSKPVQPNYCYFCKDFKQRLIKLTLLLPRLLIEI